nr:hypothetical protein [Moritella viscosa]
MTLPKLTNERFEIIKRNSIVDIRDEIGSSLFGCKHRKDMEAIVFSECDVIENFIEKVKENHGVENWDDGDLVEFIRDIQHEMINDLVSYTTLSLESYIDNNFDSQTDFAEKQGVKLPQVTQWIKKNFVVIDDVLYSSRRDLNI